MSLIYRINAAGDVWAALADGGRVIAVDPAEWGWHGPQAGDIPEWRRTVDELSGLPGFEVEVKGGPRFVPGPRPRRPIPFEGWTDGAAPPAAARSKDGITGTLGYFDRLSDALGHVARWMPVRPERGPFLVNDFISGRTIRIRYIPPAPGPGGEGAVYLITDGYGMKIGYTTLTVARRIAGLQTGNPRTIQAVATIHGVGPEIEQALHVAFGEHQGIGEWFRLDALEAAAADAGGWKPLLQWRLGKLSKGEEWQIELHSAGSSGSQDLSRRQS